MTLATITADGVPGEVIPAEVARNLIAGAADADVITWFRGLDRNLPARFGLVA